MANREEQRWIKFASEELYDLANGLGYEVGLTKLNERQFEVLATSEEYLQLKRKCGMLL